MKFVHMADMHFDSPFTSLSRIEGLSDTRRLEQRKVFKNIIEYINENNIDYLFISGDLYENEYVRYSTIEYINNLFKTIPNTKIFIAPGNHDPFLINSYYAKYEWNDNVYIFKNKLEMINLENINIYGYGFSRYYSDGLDLNIPLDNEKINILITHGDLNASKKGDELYNPVDNKDLLKFDYVALGHIHKPKYDDKIVYPGSPISFGFDELGKHGIITGEINNKKIKTEFIPLDNREFIKLNFDISEINSQEELIEKINELKINKNNFYELIFIGKRNFEINLYNINKLIENNNILKIKDFSKIKYDLEKIKEENNLKGFFVKNILEKIDTIDTEEEKQKYLKAIEIGLEALN